MEIIIPNRQLSELREFVLAQQHAETHCFAFGGFSSKQIFIGRLWRTPPHMYVCRSADSLELKRDYVVKALEYARHNNLAIIDVHSHPWTEKARFSLTDDGWALRDAKWIQQKSKEGVFPRIPWGMIVIAKSEVKARVYDYDINAFVAANLRTPTNLGNSSSIVFSDQDLFDRQIKLWGPLGQARLSKVRIAIVGLGGLGVLISEQLARIGIRKFTLIDGDKVEPSNLNRLTGFYWEHTGFFKVNISAINIKRIIGKEAEIKAIPNFLERSNLALLENNDLIVGCVDREGPRLLMNEVAIRYLIPYIDVGTGINVEGTQVMQMGGQIRFVNPGTTSCLQCYSRGIDPLEAALDLMPEDDKQTRRALGYIEGTSLSPEPSVIPLNGVLASLCVQEISKLITGFGQISTYIHYNALNNEIRVLDKEKPLRPEQACPVCGIGGLLGLAQNEKQVYVTEDECKKLREFLEA
jgi:molybdopterin/thiamine biosynthesis adenylyltransferase